MTFKINITDDLLIGMANFANEALFNWQKRWYAQRFTRNRSLHKARSIGADFYFTFEALQDACLTGRNKVFIECAPVDKDEIFVSMALSYLVNHVAQFDGRAIERDLHSTGRCIEISNGAKIYFLPENNPCCAGIVGDVYVSEWAFYANPRRAFTIVEGVACHDGWRKTTYSSRMTGDNGHVPAHLIFGDRRLFNGTVYLDTVPCVSSEMNGLLRDGFPKDVRRHFPEGEKGDRAFRETYLCQQPIHKAVR
ncbi:terminase large subunit domain-containing protein [Providencia hangzhouensis]|uniref:terminase large subunit domain-containing protein n=1 Tax=Providencia hangzhouensis TaxID=3031799 RepID=UPI0034DCCD86